MFFSGDENVRSVTTNNIHSADNVPSGYHVKNVSNRLTEQILQKLSNLSIRTHSANTLLYKILCNEFLVLLSMSAQFLLD